MSSVRSAPHSPTNTHASYPASATRSSCSSMVMPPASEPPTVPSRSSSNIRWMCRSASFPVERRSGRSSGSAENGAVGIRTTSSPAAPMYLNTSSNDSSRNSKSARKDSRGEQAAHRSDSSVNFIVWAWLPCTVSDERLLLGKAGRTARSTTARMWSRCSPGLARNAKSTRPRPKPTYRRCTAAARRRRDIRLPEHRRKAEQHYLALLDARSEAFTKATNFIGAEQFHRTRRIDKLAEMLLPKLRSREQTPAMHDLLDELRDSTTGADDASHMWFVGQLPDLDQSR